MAKKKKLKVKNLFLLFLFLILIGVGIFCLVKFVLLGEKEIIEKTSDAYISSLDNTVTLYNIEDYSEVKEIVRGTKVELYENEVTKEVEEGSNETPETYRKIKYDSNLYLVMPDDVVSKYEDSIKEKEIYVRTSLTTYKNPDSVDIAGYQKKGTKLEITGFDTLNEDGSVNMYKVKDGENESYVYPKYLVSTQDEANAVYNENGTYDYHKDRTYYFELYGGSAKNLDYYPYEKPTFEDNTLLAQSKTYYLVGTYYVLAEVDKYITLAKNAGATAFVVDIKDGALAYKSEIAKEYSPTSHQTGMNSIEFYKQAIQKIKDAGFYVIGRIVLFNDSQYAKDNPDDCIKTPYGVNTNWVSAYSRRAWEYNVKLALEAIELFDFNEIQFDYVRFPEASYNWSKNNYDFNNDYNEEKAQAVQTFLYYATDELHKTNTYVSVDVFGECSGTYVTAYGQYWPAISNIVDVVSAMPYTDHFDRNNSAYWTNPYQTVYNWGKTAAARQKEIPTPAQTRTWITAYDTPYWNVTNIYGANEISAQVKGLVDAGLGYGFMTWNSASSYSKYQAIAPAFSKEY